MTLDQFGRQWWPFPYANNTRDDWPVLDDLCAPDSPGVPLPGLNAYTLLLTPDQALKVLSALSSGLHMIYPDEEGSIYPIVEKAWNWVNNPLWWYECEPVPEVNVNICDIIQACLASDNESGTDPSDPEGPGADAGSRGDVPGNGQTTSTTDLDCVWGATEEVYAVFNDYVRVVVQRIAGLLEVIEDFSDDVVALLTFWPGITQSLANAIVSAFNAVSEIVNDDVAITSALTAVSDEVRCAIFCEIEAGGSPYTITRDAVRSGVDAWSDAMIENSLAQSAATMNVYRPLLKNTINYNTLMTRWKLSADNEGSCNNDWETLCDCGTGWCYQWADGQGRGSSSLELLPQPVFSTLPPTALVYNSVDDRFDGVFVGNSGGLIITGGSCEVTVPAGSLIEVNGSSFGAAGFDKGFIQDENGNNLVTPADAVTGPFTLTYTTPITQKVLIKVRSRTSVSVTPYIGRITISNPDGSNPYGQDNC